MPVHVRLTDGTEDVFEVSKCCANCKYPDNHIEWIWSGWRCTNCKAEIAKDGEGVTEWFNPRADVREDGALVVTRPGVDDVIGYYPRGAWTTWRIV